MAPTPKLAAFIQPEGLQMEARVYGIAFDKDGVTGSQLPSFAAVSGQNSIVYTITSLSLPTVELVRWFRSKNEKEDLYCCDWTRDTRKDDPLLLVGGLGGVIDVLNVGTDRLQRTLTGHTGDIEAIATSPLSHDLVASASADHSLRLWTLNPKYDKQPCAVIFAGGAHKEVVLTCAFHSTGRWLLSGGADHILNLWLVPDVPNETTGTDSPHIIHYPHFSTSALHTNYVDSLCFHHDLIISKAGNDEKVVIWKINGFSSSTPPLPYESAPPAHDRAQTRSAFGPGFDRLCQLKYPATKAYYVRFGFVNAQGGQPMLSLGIAGGKMSFWDIGRFSRAAPSSLVTKQYGVHQPRATQEVQAIEMSPFEGMTAHNTLSVPARTFEIWQTAFDSRGEWMAVAGARPAGIALYAIR